MQQVSYMLKAEILLEKLPQRAELLVDGILVQILTNLYIMVIKLQVRLVPLCYLQALRHQTVLAVVAQHLVIG